MRKFFICMMSIFVFQLSVPLQAIAVSRPNYPPQQCWESVAKLTMNIDYAQKGINRRMSIYYQWAVMNCRKNDFITVANAYRSNYRTLADYAYYGEPAVILKGQNANQFRVFVCNEVKKDLRIRNMVLPNPNLACKP